mgnify:CR=1 FL=1
MKNIVIVTGGFDPIHSGHIAYIQEARKLLCARAPAEDMESIFRWCYDNLDLFGDTDEQKDSAVLIIKQGLVDNALCADHEINLSATLIKLARLGH